MIPLKSPEDLERMRESCRIAAEVKEAVAALVSPGITTAELDAFASDLIVQKGAKSAFYGYRGYPGYICTSVNDEVVHGIPGKRKIKIGDIISIDVGVVYDGFVGDNATTVMVGVSDPDIIRLVRVAEQSLEAAIAEAVAGARLSNISHAVEKTVLQAGFSIVKDFVGHGVGREMHEEPQIPNYGPRGKGPKLKAGMTLAIEPMVNLGKEAVEVLSDGWTVLTKDRKPSVHVEHTIAVKPEGPAEVLTCLKKKS